MSMPLPIQALLPALKRKAALSAYEQPEEMFNDPSSAPALPQFNQPPVQQAMDLDAANQPTLPNATFARQPQIENRSFSTAGMIPIPAGGGPHPELRGKPIPAEMPQFQQESPTLPGPPPTDGVPANRSIAQLPMAPPGVRDHSTDPKRGFVKNVLHRLEHIGKGAALGAMTGGVGGMLFGAAAGGIRPEIADRAEYNLITLPRFQQQQDRQYELDTRDQQEQLRRAQIGNISADNERELAAQQAAAAERERAQKHQEAVFGETVRHNKATEGSKPITPFQQASLDRQKATAAETERYHKATEQARGQMTPAERRLEARDVEQRLGEAQKLRTGFEKSKRQLTQAQAKLSSIAAALNRPAQVDPKTKQPYFTVNGQPYTAEQLQGMKSQAETERDAIEAEFNGAKDNLSANELLTLSEDGTAVRINQARVNELRGQARSGGSGGRTVQKQPASDSIDIKEALQRYDAVPAEKKEKARQAFIKQRGIDPDTIKP